MPVYLRKRFTIVGFRRKMNEKKSSRESEDEKRIAERKDKIFVFKIGGSAFDLIREEKDKAYLFKIFEELVRAHKEDRYRMVLTCGAGPWGDVSKDVGIHFRDLGFEAISTIDDIKRSCSFTADAINRMLNQRNKTDSISYCMMETPDSLGRIASDPSILNSRIPVFVCSPQTAQADYKIKPSYASDAHSIIIADWLAARHNPGVELIFIKNAKGVYPKDPNRKDINPEENIRIKEIHIDELLNPIVVDRTGIDGRGDHLLETIAGELFRDAANLAVIRIITAKEPGRIRATLNGENRGSIIYNKNYRSNGYRATA